MNFGIVGTNFISDRFLNALKKIDKVSAPFVFSRKAETGAAFVEKHGLQTYYTNFEEFLCNPEMDAVYIASPNYAHCAQVIAALNHGKHVLCEKALVLNSKEFVQVKAAALKNQRILLEAMRPIFDPAFLLIKEQLPKLGTIRRACMEYCQYSSRYDAFKDGTILNAFKPEMLNSAVLDIGIYCLETFVYLFGKPDSVKSFSTHLSNGFEGQGVTMLSYSDMIGEIVYSKITESALPSIIQGENGSLLIEHIGNPTNVTIQYRDGREEILWHQPENINMHYEVLEFIRLVEEREVEHPYLDVSEVSIAIMGQMNQ